METALSKANRENKKLKARIAKIKLELEDLKNNFLVHLYDAIEKATSHYDVLLNPYPVEIKAVHKGKSETFEIKVTNVICILSDKTTKYIYLRHPVIAIDVEGRKTTVIEVNRNFKMVCKEIDSLEFHLFQQSKTSAVNLYYYSLNKDELILNLKEYPNEVCRKLKIGKPKIKEFITTQKGFRKIISLQKKRFGSIV